MPQNKLFTVNPGWRVLLADLGINPANILRRAGLPDDLYTRENAKLTTDEYFRLWKGIEVEAEDPLLPITIGKVVTLESFDPPIFAAMCSPNLNVALARISRYKKLIMPEHIHVTEKKKSTTIEFEWIDATIDSPDSLINAMLVFFVQLARIATREKIVPIKVKAPKIPDPDKAYEEYFGVKVEKGEAPTLVFSTEDALRPFLTSNEAMWRFFEPELQKRLSELDESASMSDRISGALLELLPGGDSAIDSVATKLRVSTRTLQRRIKAEGATYQAILNNTREKLARHYLKNSAMSGAEISFLLGYEDPNSFFRAFHSWTGQTPEGVRSALN